MGVFICKCLILNRDKPFNSLRIHAPWALTLRCETSRISSVFFSQKKSKGLVRTCSNVYLNETNHTNAKPNASVYY